MTPTNSSTEVHASREIVLRLAKKPALLAEWNNEYIECEPAKRQEDEVIFRCKTRRGDKATWTLDVSEHGSITHVAATIEEDPPLASVIPFAGGEPNGSAERRSRKALPA